MSYFPGRLEDGYAFIVRQIEQGRHVAASYDAALTNLELIRIDDRDSALRFRDDGPRFGPTCQTFTNLTWFLARQFDHCVSAI